MRQCDDKTNRRYCYRDLSTNRRHNLGADKCKALSAALQLNSILMPGADLVAKVLEHSQEKLGPYHFKQYIDERFIPKVLPKRKLSAKTQEDYNKRLAHIKAQLGKYTFDDITVKTIADFLDHYPAIHSNRYRSLLNLIFKHARAAGWTNENPVEATMKEPEDKLRTRLTKEQYDAIHEIAGKQGLIWLQNAMDLGLITLQRENELLNMKRENIIREKINGRTVEFIQVIQQKTEKYGEAAFIKIEIGQTLRTVIAHCQDNIISPYLVHRLPQRKVKSKIRDHFTKILPGYFRHKFAEMRDATGLFDTMEALARPTFHEIRSLGIKLYEDQGIDAQSLAGHKTRAMTDAYKKGHETTWTYVASM